MVQKEWKRLTLTNIYGNPSCERYVSSSLKHIWSSVCNGWRANVREATHILTSGSPLDTCHTDLRQLLELQDGLPHAVHIRQCHQVQDGGPWKKHEPPVWHSQRLAGACCLVWSTQFAPLIPPPIICEAPVHL
ncbi:hypothetical protein JB92DRAFT_2773715 [Gautieria morchelliformis]|nr:hypothetical protein JB92DRAFT_2773715 [Gautieria morchelliformis]